MSTPLCCLKILKLWIPKYYNLNRIFELYRFDRKFLFNRLYMKSYEFLHKRKGETTWNVGHIATSAKPLKKPLKNDDGGYFIWFWKLKCTWSGTKVWWYFSNSSTSLERERGMWVLISTLIYNRNCGWSLFYFDV